MEPKRWVKHVSGQGTAWEVADRYTPPQDNQWMVHNREGNNFHYLPKAEYVLCAAQR